MKTLFTAALVSALALGSAMPVLAQSKPAPAPAAVASGPVAPGIGIANLEAIVANTNAFRTAAQQRPVTYKPQIDAAETRRKAISAQLQPLVDKFNRDRAAPGAQPAVLQQQAQQIQQLQDSANQELQGLLAPAALSEAYVEEQISDKLNVAIQSAMTKRGVTLLLSPQSVLASSNSYNMNQAILTELNAAIPSAQLVPPAGWEPRQLREQRAAQAAQAGQTPAAPRAAAQPGGR